MLGNQYWNESVFDPIKTQLKSRGYGLNQIVDVFISENPDDPKYAILAVY